MSDHPEDNRPVEAAQRAVAIASHDIRGSLAAIVAHAELVVDGELSAERQEEVTRLIARNGRSLLALLDDVVFASRIDAGAERAEPTPCSIHELLEDLVELHAPEAEARGLFLELEIDRTLPASVLTDGVHLRRVLMTKVGRSVKAHDTDAREGADMVEDLIKRFLHSGLLNDLDYAVGRVNSLHRQGSSQRSIRAKLAQKGVAPQVIDQALDTLTDETPYPELAAAVTFARKKRLGPYRRPDTDDRDEEEVRKRREKEMAAMARAGFGYEMVRKVIEAENIESLEEELRSPPE